jgi:hypothetical protein
MQAHAVVGLDPALPHIGRRGRHVPVGEEDERVEHASSTADEDGQCNREPRHRRPMAWPAGGG